MTKTNIVNLDKYKIIKTRSNKVLEMLKENSNKEINLNEFIEKSNFLIFAKTSKIIEKVKKQYSKELNQNVINLIAYLKNLNNSHNIFYNGFKLSLGYNKSFKLVDLKEFEQLNINCVVVEYREQKDKNKGVQNEN